MIDKKSTTLSIVPFDTEPTEYTTHVPSNPKRIFTSRIANCQLMFESGGAFFEFPMPPKSSPVCVGRQSSPDGQSTAIDLSNFNGFDFGVSRTHARFERSGSRVFLRDLNSTNGTRLNGKRLTPMNVHEVFHGDKIEFGRLPARFYIKS